MGIATLIAAGRLDDRLVDRALGLLRELDPEARFVAWIDEGDAADLRFRRRPSRRRAGRSIRSARRCRIVQADEPRWRRLLVADMDSTDHRSGMHRRAGRLCRAQDRGRRDHRARDAGRARFQGALRERVRAACRDWTQGTLARCLAERVPLTSGRADFGPDDARRRGELPAGFGRLPVLRRADRQAGRIRPRPRQPPGVRRRQTERRSRAIRSSTRAPSGRR